MQQGKVIAALGDKNPHTYGGGFVWMDETGKRPQVEYLPHGYEDEDEAKTLSRPMYRFDIDKCTFIDGVLSDNQFHPNHAAWWADSLDAMANTYGVTAADLVALFCSDDPLIRAQAYVMLGEYFGFENLDEYPLEYTGDEAEEWAEQGWEFLKK